MSPCNSSRAIYLHMTHSSIALFEQKEIRKITHHDEWWFSIIDVISVLDVTGREPRKYWSDLKQKLISEGYTEVSDTIGQLKMIAEDGKMRLTDCANTETLLRIIQSIPSPKAEPFKRWLAQVGYERIQENFKVTHLTRWNLRDLRYYGRYVGYYGWNPLDWVRWFQASTIYSKMQL